MNLEASEIVEIMRLMTIVKIFISYHNHFSVVNCKLNTIPYRIAQFHTQNSSSHSHQRQDDKLYDIWIIYIKHRIDMCMPVKRNMLSNFYAELFTFLLLLFISFFISITTAYYLYDTNNRNKFCFKLLIVYSFDVMVIMIQPYFVHDVSKGLQKLF